MPDTEIRTAAQPASSAADDSYWHEMWARRALVYDESSIPFKDLFAKHMPHGGDCLEIGCYPGGFLIYLSRKFGLRAYGIDNYPGVDQGFRSYLAQAGVNVGEVVEEDFFRFAPQRQFDVVCSFGFVEHFFRFREVLARHAEFVAPGGLLIVTCPNFRHLQFLLHWLFDRESLGKHVIEAMDLTAWEQTLRNSGMEIVEKGYSETFLFWVESTSGRARRIPGLIAKFASWLNKRVRQPNRFLSPFMFCIARKTAERKADNGTDKPEPVAVGTAE